MRFDAGMGVHGVGSRSFQHCASPRSLRDGFVSNLRCSTVHRVDNARLRKRIPLQQTMHSLPGDFPAAVAATKPFPPEFDDTRPEF